MSTNESWPTKKTGITLRFTWFWINTPRGTRTAAGSVCSAFPPQQISAGIGGSPPPLHGPCRQQPAGFSSSAGTCCSDLLQGNLRSQLVTGRTEHHFISTRGQLERSMSQMSPQFYIKYVRNHSHWIYAAMMSWTIISNLNSIKKRRQKQAA